MSVLVLGLTAAALWGAGDFLGGFASRRARLLAVVTVSQLAGAGLLVSVLLAGGAGGMPALERLVPGFVGGAIVVLTLLAFYRGLAIGAMSIVAPLSATGAVVPLAVDLIRGERPGPLALSGMVLALGGAALAARAPGRASREGIGLALVAALGFGTFATLLAEAARDDVVWGVLSVRAASVPLILALVIAAAVPLRMPRRGLAFAVGAGVLDTTANLAYAAGTQRGLTSVVAVLSALYPLITVGLAQSVLGERIGSAQGVGVLGALAGVALIAAG